MVRINQSYTWAGMLLLFLMGIGKIQAQRSEFYMDSERKLKDGIDLYQKQKYGVAQTFFSDYKNAVTFKGTATATRYSMAEADYYYAACAVELFQIDAQRLMEDFIQDYPESPKIPLAKFHLGKLLFREKEYKKAINQFLETDIYQLTKEQYAEYCYKLGYSYFMVKEYGNALKNFAIIKDAKNIYAIPATYYYAHISYLEKNYEVALQHFLKLKDDKKFGPIVPFYIAQIYYIQGKYQEVVTYAAPMADTLKGKNFGLVRRILAESYFEIKDYPNSVKNYELYMEGGSTLDREGHYRLGLAYYFTKNYTGAGEHLKEATSENDKISQSAYYYLADCLIRTDQKRPALEALKFAFTYDYDPAITKEALYNFAKLSYELGYNPYNEAIDALNTYLTKYPDASNKDEAYELLANIYLSTRNYKDALASIAKVKVKSSALKIAEQKIYLFRGIELFNNLEYTDAITHFDNAVDKNFDHKIASTAKFWRADAYFRQGDYVKAEAGFNDFLSSPQAKDLTIYDDGFYNLGYAYFKRKKYAPALVEFKNYIDKAQQNDRKVTDAYVRIADCYFMEKNYPKAVEYYDKSINSVNPANDYALMQKGTILGLEGKQGDKILALKKIADDYPQSPFIESVLYELGIAYSLQSQFNDAVQCYEKLVNQHAGSVYMVKSYLQLGLIYFNADNNREALGWYKRVVDEYPNTVYSKTALNYIRNIYVELGDDDGWQNYLAGLDNISYSASAQDSTSWEIAEKSVDSQDCGKITDAMGKYLDKYPNGLFKLLAHHYRGDCYYQNKNYQASAGDYEFIIQQKNNDYTIDALLKLVYVYNLNYDSVKLERIYTQLEENSGTPANLQKARIGLMRTKFTLKKYQDASNYAGLVKTYANLDPEVLQQAHFIKGKSLYELGDYANALVELKYFQSKTSSDFYPEAMYHIALIQYQNEQYKDAEKTLTKAVKYMGGQKNSLARSFILLSDVYVAMGNLVEAKGLLQTVIANHDGQDLIDLAQSKLDAILEMERRKNIPNTTNDWEIDMNGTNRNIKEPKDTNNIRN